MDTTQLDHIARTTTDLLTAQCDTLTALMASPLYRKEDESHADLHELCTALHNEAQKTANLEMTLAVVGTMKAGKSTVINAIVGQEILPNRNQPMTTLPTLIRHTAGQTTPVLLFTKLMPIQVLIQRICHKLTQGDGGQQTWKSETVAQLAQELTQTEPVLAKKHTGQAAIFTFLSFINDLFRLATELGIKPPYQDYKKLHDLPVIEVEFQHLNTADSKGKLSILDTPGPNEFGQSAELRQVFKTQLKQASGVLLVIDYTQLGSESEHQVREQVNAIRATLGNRLYVLVNKFDNKNRNSINYEQTKAHVAKYLMQGEFDQEDVFPASASLAFLSNYVLQYLQRQPCIDLEDSILNDFADRLHLDWDDFETDELREKLQPLAASLWKKSRFHEPITSVINESYRNAANHCIRSGLEKSIRASTMQADLLHARQVSIDKNAEQLDDIIHSIDSDINQISDLEKNIDKLLSHILNDVLTKFEGIQRLRATELHQHIENFFSPQKKPAVSIDYNHDNHNDLLSIFNHLRKNKPVTPQPATVNFNYSLNQGIQIFSNKEEADSYSNVINHYMLNAFQDFSSEMGSLFEKIPMHVALLAEKKLQEQCLDIIEKSKQMLKGENITLNVAIHPADFDGLDIDYEHLLKDNVKTMTERVSTQTKPDGFIEMMKTILGFKAYEFNYVDKNVHMVDINAIHRNLIRKADYLAKDAATINHNQIKHNIEPQLKEKLVSIKRYLGRYRNELEKVIGDKQQSQQQQEDIKRLLLEYTETFQDYLSRAQNITL